MNQIRSVLLERGYIVPQGRAKLAARLAELPTGPARVLSPRIRAPIDDMPDRWRVLDNRITAFDREFARQTQYEYTRRLTTIPGIGVLNATTLVAAGGESRKRYLFVAIDRRTRSAHLAIEDDATETSALAFLDEVVTAFPFQIRTILTDRDSCFTTDAFSAQCQKRGAQHRIDQAICASNERYG